MKMQERLKSCFRKIRQYAHNSRYPLVPFRTWKILKPKYFLHNSISIDVRPVCVFVFLNNLMPWVTDLMTVERAEEPDNSLVELLAE